MTTTQTIYSVGYERLTPATLKRLVLDLDVTLLDVRSRPSGRVKRGFSRKDLEKLLPGRYEWAGDRLGGKGKGVTREGLDALAKDRRRLLLLCQEHAPADCHRFHGIALPLLERGINVLHVFEDEVIETTDLGRALENESEYLCYELAEVIEEMKGGKES